VAAFFTTTLNLQVPVQVPLLQKRLADSMSTSQLPECFSPVQAQDHVPVALLPFIRAMITFPLPSLTNLYPSFKWTAPSLITTPSMPSGKRLTNGFPFLAAEFSVLTPSERLGGVLAFTFCVCPLALNAQLRGYRVINAPATNIPVTTRIELIRFMIFLLLLCGDLSPPWIECAYRLNAMGLMITA
jgi:hypothetical protein